MERVEEAKPLALQPALVGVDASVRVLAEEVERIPLGTKEGLRYFLDTMLELDAADLGPTLAVDLEQSSFNVRAQVLDEESRGSAHADT